MGTSQLFISVCGWLEHGQSIHLEPKSERDSSNLGKKVGNLLESFVKPFNQCHLCCASPYIVILHFIHSSRHNLTHQSKVEQSKIYQELQKKVKKELAAMPKPVWCLSSASFCVGPKLRSTTVVSFLPSRSRNSDVFVFRPPRSEDRGNAPLSCGVSFSFSCFSVFQSLQFFDRSSFSIVAAILSTCYSRRRVECHADDIVSIFLFFPSRRNVTAFA